MSVRPVEPFLAVFQSGLYQDFIKSIIFSGIRFESLNPSDLGPTWSEVQFIEPKINPVTVDRQKIDFILSKYQPKGLFAGLLDSRVSASLEDIQNARQNKQKLLVLADSLSDFFYFEDLETEVLKVIKANPNKTLAFGHNLEEFNEKLSAFGKSVIEDFAADHAELDFPQEVPEVDLIKLTDKHQVLVFDETHTDYVFNFKPETIHEYSIFSKEDFFDFIFSSKDELAQKCAAEDINPLNLSESKKVEFAALYADLELEDLISKVEKHVFALSKSEQTKKSLFAFLAVHPDDVTRFEKIAEQNQVILQPTDWEEEIVVWKQTTNLEPFKGVAESIATINTKEVDPSIMISLFFSLFFAFCLGDALYGLTLTLFCGYFIFFKKLKAGISNTFRMFFVAGLATILFGVLMNSWAGDLFLKTPLNAFLEFFQIINPLDSTAKLPLNTYLASIGLSPIVALLGFSVFIGLINILTGYVLKIINSAKSGETADFLDDSSWFAFIVAIILWVVDLALATPPT